MALEKRIPLICIQGPLKDIAAFMCRSHLMIWQYIILIEMSKTDPNARRCWTLCLFQLFWLHCVTVGFSCLQCHWFKWRQTFKGHYQITGLINMSVLFNHIR